MAHSDTSDVSGQNPAPASGAPADELIVEAACAWAGVPVEVPDSAPPAPGEALLATLAAKAAAKRAADEAARAAEARAQTARAGHVGRAVAQRVLREMDRAAEGGAHGYATTETFTGGYTFEEARAAAEAMLAALGEAGANTAHGEAPTAPADDTHVHFWARVETVEFEAAPPAPPAPPAAQTRRRTVEEALTLTWKSPNQRSYTLGRDGSGELEVYRGVNYVDTLLNCEDLAYPDEAAEWYHGDGRSAPAREGRTADELLVEVACAWAGVPVDVPVEAPAAPPAAQGPSAVETGFRVLVSAFWG